MHELPSSIEAYLEEAGFSGTEILILRRLMDGEPLTIRQLGAKTGKSTGVLDQAMKKLMKKNIIKRALINETPKYSLDSLEAVVEWMQEDMEQKREMLLRRHQNFESFVTSLETGSKRPDIEYFEGDSGIKQAYIKLLNGPGEILHYLPVMYKEEEDPLRDFRVQYFRERQLRKMFSRVLAHDTVLGHRYQSRDAFEYRKTVLVSEKEYPFSFEKIITGDRIACIDHNAKTACVIRYPELADVERTLFEAIWRQVQMKPESSGIAAQAPSYEPEKISRSTEAVSQLREFFLSSKSLVALGVCALLAGFTTFGLYKQNIALNLARIQERAASIASTAALQFDLKDLEKIQTESDIRLPEYAKVIYQLNRVRRQNPGVTYIYLLRPTENTNEVAFIADADSLDPYAEIDLNKDGQINEMDQLNIPGERYNISQDPALKKAMETGQISVNESTYTDQWGTFISATAPLRDANDNIVAALGVDIAADQLYKLTNSQFQFIGYFVGFLFLFLIVRFLAFTPIRISVGLAYKIFAIASVIVICVVLGFFALKSYRQNIVRDEVGQRLMAIAATAASQFRPYELENLRFAKDMRTVEYQRVFNKLNEIRDNNERIKWIYILRSTDQDQVWEFVADADANHFLEPSEDENLNGIIEPEEENVAPGTKYFSQNESLREGLLRPSYTKDYDIDQWGVIMTGVAPIGSGYILGIDMSEEWVIRY